MGKTNRFEPRDGNFKRLHGSTKRQRNKKQRVTKTNLMKDIRFASKHRANIDMTQMSASLYMEETNTIVDK